MTTTLDQATEQKPILAGWLELEAAERFKLFPNPDHRMAAEVFANHADRFLQPSGAYRFPIAYNMELTVSSAAVGKMLRRDKLTAEAMAKIVTLKVGDIKRQAAIQTLLQLVWYLEK